MGLDAYVPCLCWEQGKCQPPPFPAEWLERSEGHVQLKREFDSQERWDALTEWEESCCAHPRMEAASERLSNWSGYRAFQETILRENFPVLQAELPNSNGGYLPHELVEPALRELEAFLVLPEVGREVELLCDGRFYQHYVETYQGLFLYDGRSGYNMGVDPRGLFIRHDKTGEEVFRAMRGRVEDWWPVKLEAQEFEVRERVRRPRDFEYITKPLRHLFLTALEHGSVVHWC